MATRFAKDEAKRRKKIRANEAAGGRTRPIEHE